MRHFPAFLDLSGRTVLLLGAGEALEAKARLVAAAGGVAREAGQFSPDLLEGCAAAFAAGAEEADLLALSREAQARGVPVNVVDRPELSSFITPAIVERGPVTVGISTGGAAPVLARLLRQRIEAVLPPGIAALGELAERFRHAVRRALPETGARRRFLERVLAGPVAELAVAGRVAEAEAGFARALADHDGGAAGFVHLVGAGPGAADLLTLRALRVLGEADVVVHDRLVPQEVLDLARRDARRIFVGKARANHCVPQEGINALLVDLGRQGLRVVRLKGGDPFVFGRGGEEAEALAEAGIPFEVIPGVTAALACGAATGIPLTHRDCAQALVLATGHTRNGEVGLDFAALARPGHTLAVYMGVSTLGRVRDGLVEAGLDPATPAALVENGGMASQRLLTGTLTEVAARGPGWSAGGPALLLVGEAVARRAGRVPAMELARTA
ncbi:siroheme synthase CysG [Roseomonas sp. OT10]|uniref:siroheme synthase CysG n=1 Tax=Roseomonas cutis TaxID=2897332 RepID=UPI001E4BC67B|nr:siroheme synthase CysG [Roseomonas sp. OT10]UFN48213.1 siroheme synthase CysG [Roseomonas sp. OT10]